MLRVKQLTISMLMCSLVCSTAGVSRASEVEGTITGTVLTEGGLLATNMRVCTSVHQTSGGFDHTVTCCNARTDDQGRFTIEHLELGKYQVMATNDEQGYSIENQSPGQDVTISERNPRQTVTIRLHNKGAVVIAAITDKSTGKIIHDANFEYTGVDCEAGGNMLRDIEGHYYLSIPTNCDVVVIARAKGYRGWVYTDTANTTRPVLRLAPGQRELLNIQLETVPKESSKR